MFDELKPCPFCGGEAHLFVDSGVRVICPKCGATTKRLADSMSGNRVAGNATRAVVEAWNRRTGENVTLTVSGVPIPSEENSRYLEHMMKRMKGTSEDRK